MSDTYRVKRIFPTIQGEGFWAGVPATFVRLVGCNMWSGYEEDREEYAEATGADCPMWCDTDFTKEGSQDLEAKGVLQRLENHDPDHVVFTGGEPLLQLDEGLVYLLQRNGYYVHVETNGSVPLLRNGFSTSVLDPGIPDWICCSPKLPEDQIELKVIHELKLIVPDYHPRDYSSLAGRVKAQGMGGERRRPLYVQPEDGPRLEEAKEMAVAIASEAEGWLISTQSHKTLGID